MFSSDTPSLTRTNALLQYGNLTALNADFSAYAVSGGFMLGGWVLDGGTVTGTITVTSGASTSSVNLSLLAAAITSPVNYFVPLSAFTGINWADVDVIALGFSNNSGGQDFGFTGFAVVPAPGSAALLGLGGLLVARRRR